MLSFILILSVLVAPAPEQNGGAADQWTPAGDSHRGCCSHHQGVCGCQGGRALCCDGQLSPSCGCD